MNTDAYTLTATEAPAASKLDVEKSKSRGKPATERSISVSDPGPSWRPIGGWEKRLSKGEPGAESSRLKKKLATQRIKLPLERSRGRGVPSPINSRD